MRDVKTTRFETYKEVAIVEKSVVKQCVFRVGSMLVCTESVAEFIDNETYKEVAIVETSVVKQCIPPGFVLSCSDACMQADTVYGEAGVQRDQLLRQVS